MSDWHEDMVGCLVAFSHDSGEDSLYNDTGDPNYVIHLHHDSMMIEEQTEPIIHRFAVIATEKYEGERSQRFATMRPLPRYANHYGPNLSGHGAFVLQGTIIETFRSAISAAQDAYYDTELSDPANYEQYEADRNKRNATFETARVTAAKVMQEALRELHDKVCPVEVDYLQRAIGPGCSWHFVGESDETGTILGTYDDRKQTWSDGFAFFQFVRVG